MREYVYQAIEGEIENPFEAVVHQSILGAQDFVDCETTWRRHEYDIIVVPLTTGKLLIETEAGETISDYCKNGQDSCVSPRQVKNSGLKNKALI